MTIVHRPYRHTQVGWQVYGVLIPLTLVLMYGLGTREAAVFNLILTIFAAVVALFGSLTVEINARRLLIKFGIGLIRRRISLDTIRAFAPVRNRWYYGWGIRFTPHGILYNVAGLQAVEILLDDGRRVRVGTDEPDALVRALQAATAVTPAKTIDEFPKDVAWRRRVRVITAVIVALTAALILGQVYVYSQPPAVAVANGRFSAGLGLYGIDIPISDMQSLELVDTLPRIQNRTNGYSAGGLLRGNFRLEAWGSGKLFINRNSPPYVVVRTRDSFVVVNSKMPPERVSCMASSARWLEVRSLEANAHETREVFRRRHTRRVHRRSGRRLRLDHHG